MNTILEKLYNGEISPAEQFRPQSEEYRALWRRNLREYEAFVQKLGEPLAREFRQIMDDHLDGCPLELSGAFIDGFRLGARMMIDVYESPART